MLQIHLGKCVKWPKSSAEMGRYIISESPHQLQTSESAECEQGFFICDQQRALRLTGTHRRIQ